MEGVDRDNNHEDEDDEISEGEDMDDDDEEEESDDNENNDDEEMKIEDEYIVEKFIRTFHNGNYDAKFDNALILDRKIISPAWPTEALVVWNEPILDDYWEQLEEEINLNKHLGIVTEIDHIEITNEEIKKERLDALVYIFRNGRATNSITFLQFINANLCEEGIISLSKLVDVSSELQTFCLCHNWIDSMDSARCLSMSLKSHSSINKLHLDHCDLGSNPEMLSVILQSDVEYITLVNNNIDSLGAVKIAEYLEGDPLIQRIGLDCNRLNDDDAIIISKALKRNRNLRHLDLERNNFTSIGVKALLTCVFDGSSLNAISESNHTLAFIYILYKNVSLVGGIDRMLGLERTEKILFALQDKESLLKYLANVPVELMPDVLAFSKHKLNIVYYTMRWWNMPMLYSYHHSCVKTDIKRRRVD